jgi:hypothetical protein
LVYRAIAAAVFVPSEALIHALREQQPAIEVDLDQLGLGEILTGKL